MRKRHRATNMWQPTWSSKIERWTAYQIRKNLWRFDTLNDFDDVMQEARILFWKLQKLYPIVKDPNHFFILYKTSLSRSFIDRSRAKKHSTDDNISVDDENLNLESNLQNYGPLSLLLNELPDELKTVLGALTSGRIRVKLDRPTISKRRRENFNMRLKRRFSLETSDPVGDLRRYFIHS